jgi:hypothetical protein
MYQLYVKTTGRFFSALICLLCRVTRLVTANVFACVQPWKNNVHNHSMCTMDD